MLIYFTVSQTVEQENLSGLAISMYCITYKNKI